MTVFLYRYQPYIVVVLLSVTLSCSGCVVILHELKITPLDTLQLPEQVSAGLRVHTGDGHILLFPEGAWFSADSLHGTGTLYGLDLKEIRIIESYPLDNVHALEHFSTEKDIKGSRTVSVLGTVVIAGTVFYVSYALALASLLSHGN